MSGVTGIIGLRALATECEADLAAMGRCLREGMAGTVPDGHVHDKRLNASVAWTRRDHESERMAWNRARDICLIFIGDDFDIEAKATALRIRGESPRNHTECLVQRYEEIGEKFVVELNGRFTGVILDRRRQQVLLFNDRYGANRVYFHHAPDGVLFSTKASSLLAILPDARQIDQRGLAEFYSVGCTLQNRSLFKDIFLLPPASFWTLRPDGTIQRQRYFDPTSWEQQAPLSAEDYNTRLSEVFGRIVPKYLRAPHGVAMSLTGGLDSRMILAWSGATPQTLPCYTFGGPYRDCADVRIARRLAQACKQPHTTIPIEADFFEQFPLLAEKSIAVTDGTMDVSGAVELYVNQRARQISPIRITGNYGSEILRANVAFRPAKLDTSLFVPEFDHLLQEAADTYRQEAAGHRLSFIAFKQVPWHHYGRFAAESAELSPRSPFLDNELVALAYRVPPHLVGSAAPLLKLISTGNSKLDSIRTDRALRMRAIAGVSTLAHRWQEFTAKAEYAYDYGMPQWLARADRMVKPLHLEKLFLGRHKFYHFRIWYRDQLRDSLRAKSFASVSQPSCYRDGAAEKLVSEHTSGRANRTLELHKLLAVQLIDRLFTGAPCRS